MRKELFNRLSRQPWFIRYSRWEFWPSWLMYSPVLAIWLIQAIRAGRLFFFSSVNPVIPTGGWLGESKWDILRRIPAEYVPPTLFIEAHTPPDVVFRQLARSDLSYPLVAKPDVGERGFLVKVIKNQEALLHYLGEVQVAFMLQAFIDYPLEVSALCYRIPGTDEAELTSLCTKEFLAVTGDGQSTLEELLDRTPRAILQRDRLRAEFHQEWKQVLPLGTVLELEPIGNHCRGTRFVDANHLIDTSLQEVLVGLLDRMGGIHYGRFDLRTSSMEDLRQGKNFKIFEFNGVGSDPAHIYDPENSLWSGYRDIWKHFSIMRKIFRKQKEKGIYPVGFHEARRAYIGHLRYKRQAKKAMPPVHPPEEQVRRNAEGLIPENA